MNKISTENPKLSKGSNKDFTEWTNIWNSLEIIHLYENNS